MAMDRTNLQVLVVRNSRIDWTEIYRVVGHYAGDVTLLVKQWLLYRGVPHTMSISYIEI